MKFCSTCGATVTVRIPDGDNRERHVCTSVDCAAIHYQNPRIVTGCLPVWEDRVLLCQRAIDPRRGYWTLPAGFLENGESITAGAMRETREEANASVSNLRLYTVYSLPHISQAYMFYLADLDAPSFESGVESLDVQLFEEADIPWEDLAFPVIKLSLEAYFADRDSQQFPVRYEELDFSRRRDPIR